MTMYLTHGNVQHS